MIPVLVGLAALGGVVIASQSGNSDNTNGSRKINDSEVPEEIRMSIRKQEADIALDLSLSDDDSNPESEKTTRRVIEESEVPEAIRKEINMQEDNEIIVAIKKLSDLYKVGILTEEEFAAKKKELLSRL